MLGLIVMFACFILVALFALMNQDVPDAVLQIRLASFGTYQTTAAPWLLIALSLFAGAVIQFLVGHGREMALRHRLREKDTELQETKEHLRKVEDALLELVPKRIEQPLLEAREEQPPPEEVT